MGKRKNIKIKNITCKDKLPDYGDIQYIKEGNYYTEIIVNPKIINVKCICGKCFKYDRD